MSHIERVLHEHTWNVNSHRLPTPEEKSRGILMITHYNCWCGGRKEIHEVMHDDDLDEIKHVMVRKP